MVVVAGILMLVIVIFVVAYPFFQSPKALSRPATASSDEDLAELLARRNATYVALKELELDHKMGKLSLADYQVLRNEYRAQAVTILQELDSRQVEAQGAEDRTLEREIEREVAARRRRGLARCPGCGSAFEPGDRFCRHCGVALRKEQA